jgi:outer membrane lipoprotein-sorting protein
MKYLTTRIPALSGIILLAAVMVFLPASCQNDPDPGSGPQIPAALQNTEWQNQDGDTVSFTKDSVTVKTASGQQQTFVLKDSQYVAEISQTTLFFSDDKTKDQIVFRNGSVTMVNLGGVNKPTANWNDKNDTGTGVFGDFRYSYTSSAVTITGYNGNGGDITIPLVIDGKPVKIISDPPKNQYGDFIPDGGVFYEKNLTSVTLPDSITYIGSYAFTKNNLTNIVIPGSVAFIGRSAFSNNQLAEITIPNGITSIEDYTFFINRLTNFIIPNSVTSIGESAFWSNRLTSIIIPDSVTTIGNGAFTNNLLTSVIISNNVTTIEGFTFSNNQLSSVIIPDSVSLIKMSAFTANPLTSITIGANVSLEDHSVAGYSSQFNEAYNNNGKQAGTYTRYGFYPNSPDSGTWGIW